MCSTTSISLKFFFPETKALISCICHTPNLGVWSARDKYTPMPPKPWPTSYLLKFRHDLTRLKRSPTCKSRNPQTVIHHTTYAQVISIINYIFIHIISKCIQNYQLSTEYLCNVWFNETKHDKKTTHDALRWRYMDPSSSNGPHVKSEPSSPMDVCELNLWGIRGPGWSIFVKTTTKQWVSIIFGKHKP